MLKKDENPQLSVEGFLALCLPWVDEERMEFLTKLDLRPVEGLKASPQSSVGQYLSWEAAVRESLAKVRAAKLGRQDFVADDEKASYEADRIALESAAAPNPLERERFLDAARWNKLEELEFGHYFDFELLCTYKLKLLLRRKWQERQLERGVKNLDKAVDAVQAAKQNS